MKIFLVILVLGAGFFYWQNKNGPPASTDTGKNHVSATASVTPRPVSEHDWAKHSLDRVHEVTDQVARTRKVNQQP